MIRKIKKCRICDNTNLVKVLDLGQQNLTGVFPKKKNQLITKGPLQLLKCHSQQKKTEFCGLLQLAHNYDESEMYGENYGYRSGLNSSMVCHLKKKVKNILKKINLKKADLIVDIGSNDGTTLNAYPNNGYNLVGIDPTGNKFRKYYPKNAKLINSFFSSNIFRKYFNKKKAKVITSFSMFYDLPDPMNFVKEIKKILSLDGIWVFEQSYMPTMIKKNAYDTVCHEHLEYYGLYQIKWMTDRLRLKIIDVSFNDVNGGSFSITVAHEKSSYDTYPYLKKIIQKEKKDYVNVIDNYLKFKKNIKKAKFSLLKFLNNAKKNKKKVGALGASTKGNVILQYCGITKNEISFIGEVNPDKFGCYTPGTLIPIISENKILKMNLDYYIVLPWHFKKFFIDNKKFKKRKLIMPLPSLKIYQ